MFQINSTIKLFGKTQKGKNRIRELGDSWRIICIESKVFFDSRDGSWAKIEPIALDNHLRQSNAVRWIHLFKDKDFEVSNV